MQGLGAFARHSWGYSPVSGYVHKGLGFRVWGLGFGVLGFRGLGFRVWGFRV